MNLTYNRIFWGLIGSALLLTVTAADVGALDTPTQTPFLYIIDYTPNQYRDKEFWKKFDPFVPDLYHPGADNRYLNSFGGAGEAPDESFDVYKGQIQSYLNYLHKKGVQWVTPYLCIQTITGNDKARTGAWDIYDHWEKYQFLGLGPKPPDPLLWMQREPSGRLHYNYKRMCFLSRGQSADRIRYAPCPNNPYWRAFCDNEARLGAQLGFDGFFIDNCIIHCYCPHCEKRFQTYLKKKYTLEQLQEAFGTKNYTDIQLYKEGDLRYWARAFPQFIPWLEKKYPPKDRRIPFDTTGPLDSKHVDNAGGGMLTGEASAFIAETVLRPGTQPNFENVRLANPALQSPVGRLRWAETMMFWSDSIGDMLAEMRDAGRTVNPNFFLIPNWGTMQRVYGAAGRAESGHDMERWKTGADWQMYEEGYTTGLIGPGLVLDYDMELRFALANGIRPMLLPYKLNGADVEKVALAETAASGNGILVDTFNYPEIQIQYQKFFRSHGDLYDGYHSAAKVALAYLFNQTYYLNIEHFRQVHALNRYLADQQIPFDIVIEKDLVSNTLDRYRVVILPNTAFLDDRELDTLHRFLRHGGTLILIGDCGTHDLYCRPRKESTLTARFRSRKGQVIRFNNLSEALPQPGLFFEPGIQTAESFDSLGEKAFGKYANLATLDKKLWFKRYQDPGPLTPVIAKALGRNPHLLDPWDASGLRNTIYFRENNGKDRIIVHLVNKNVPLAVPVEERKLRPVRDLALHIPLPTGSHVSAVQCFEVDRQSRPLSWTTDRSSGVTTIPLDVLSAYAVISIECQRK